MHSVAVEGIGDIAFDPTSLIEPRRLGTLRRGRISSSACSTTRWSSVELSAIDGAQWPEKSRSAPGVCQVSVLETQQGRLWHVRLGHLRRST